MVYKSWNNRWGDIGIGFDKGELGMVTFNISICVPHRYLFIDLALLGFNFYAHIFEREDDKQVESGS